MEVLMLAARKFVRFLCCAALSSFAALAVASGLAAHQEQGQMFEGPGGKIYYEILGAAPGTPLIVVNGGPGFDHTYLHAATVWEFIAKSRRVVFYDQRGDGRSAPLKDGQSCTLADQIADLEALRAHLGAEKIDILGHSWGGYLTMAYGARHPQHISHMILVDSAAPKWSDTIFLFSQVFPETSERRAAAAFASELGDKGAIARGIREYLTMLFYSPEKRAAFLTSMSDDAYHDEVFRSIIRDLPRFDLNPELAKFRFRALVITGRYDMNVAPLVAYRIQQAIPGAEFAVFDRSGHLPFYEEPENFSAALQAFLAKPEHQ
jgi:proline iminopeptidase